MSEPEAAQGPSAAAPACSWRKCKIGGDSAGEPVTDRAMKVTLGQDCCTDTSSCR